MAINMIIWDKTSNIKLADGTPCTPAEVFTRYPFTQDGTIVFELLPNGNVGGIDSMPMLRTIHEIDETLSDEDALAAIIVKRNTPPEPVVDPVEAKLDYIIMVSE